MSSSQ